MGMRYCAVSEYGMLLNSKTMKLLAESIECRIGHINYMSSFTGEAIPIDDFGHDVFLADSETYSDDIIYFICVNKQPSLFAASYCCIDELVAGFKSLLMHYLPDDFDYRGNIRHLDRFVLGGNIVQ